MLTRFIVMIILPKYTNTKSSCCIPETEYNVKSIISQKLSKPQWKKIQLPSHIFSLFILCLYWFMYEFTILRTQSYIFTTLIYVLTVCLLKIHIESILFYLETNVLVSLQNILNCLFYHRLHWCLNNFSLQMCISIYIYAYLYLYIGNFIFSTFLLKHLSLKSIWIAPLVCLLPYFNINSSHLVHQDSVKYLPLYPF